MKWQSELSFEASNRVVLLAGPQGEARQRYLTQWLEQARRQGHAVWQLPCDMRRMGPWAGLIELFGELVPRLEAQAPHLLVKHDYELAIVMPVLERTFKVRNPTLTDVSSESERTRNYPMDRAYRIVHGLVDLLAEAQQVLGDPAYALACDEIEHSGALVRMFFSELVRRKGEGMNVHLLLSAEASSSAALARQFPSLSHGVRFEGAEAPRPTLAPRDMALRAQNLERQAERDALERQSLLPQLIHAWLNSDQPAKALPYQIEAFSIYNTRGLYEDALFYGQPALEALEKYSPDSLLDRMNVCVKLYSSYLGLRRHVEAERVVEMAMSSTSNPKFLGQWRYMNAMLYARFFPQRDFTRAEQELDLGMEELEQSDLAPPTKAFMMAFNRNGLALVRHLQGRPEEAIALCQWGYQHLASALTSQDQRLHRSILIYNIAQVYATMGRFPEAIQYLGEAMSVDPHYSEYYNERGSIYMKLERYEEALTDYHRAIELSPPYMEVWTNLGQCFQAMGRLPEAVQAYSRALDLDTQAQLALIGRAQAHDSLGHAQEALADYDALLAMEPRQHLVLMNRAVLHFDAGRVEQALEDLDRAIAVAPQMADLYLNRAVALKSLGRQEQALQDEETATRLMAA